MKCPSNQKNAYHENEINPRDRHLKVTPLGFYFLWKFVKDIFQLLKVYGTHIS